MRDARLELVALYFHACHRADEPGLPADDRLTAAARVFGYLLGVHAAGWTQFCHRLGVTTSVLEALLPGGEAIRVVEQAARTDGLTADEAAGWLG